jgi:hypothetical protein
MKFYYEFAIVVTGHRDELMTYELMKPRTPAKQWKLGPSQLQQPPRTLRLVRELIVAMDSPLISRLFKQLFAHRACQAVRPRLRPSPRLPSSRRTQVRCYSRRNEQDADAPKNESHWQQRTTVFSEDMSAEYAKYPMVTADQLRGRRERPRRVKMLTRDFIEGKAPSIPPLCTN